MDDDSIDDERVEDCDELGSLELLLLDESSLALKLPASREPPMQIASARSNNLRFIMMPFVGRFVPPRSTRQ